MKEEGHVLFKPGAAGKVETAPPVLPTPKKKAQPKKEEAGPKEEPEEGDADLPPRKKAKKGARVKHESSESDSE